MKTCQHCGTALPDEVKFCGVCGNAASAPVAEEAPVAQTVPAAEPVAPAAPAAAEAPYVPPVYVAPPVPVQPYAPVQEKKDSISIGGWIGRELIPLIPLVGGIIYFVMLWVWAADKTKEDSFRNWAKSRLIWLAIAVGLTLFTVVMVAVLGFSVMDVLEESVYY